MDWITGLQRAIDYVEENLCSEIDFEEVAKRAVSSSFHFQRVFGFLCGYTLGDYIRMRRLTKAGEELLSGKVKVIDVAFKYGYDTPESFSRAFARFHGVTPREVKNGSNIKAFSRISVKLTLNGGSTMEFRIENKEKFSIICKRIRVENKEKAPTQKISEFWKACVTDGTIEKICKYMPKENIFGKGIVGISFMSDFKNYQFPYGIGAPYNGMPVAEKELSVVEIPAYTYAIFKCKGKMPEAFIKTYKQICEEFFPSSEYQPNYGVEFEVYPSAEVDNPDYSCEIWVSVDKK